MDIGYVDISFLFTLSLEKSAELRVNFFGKIDYACCGLQI